MTIHVTTKYFTHESGTKFYEVVQFWNADKNLFLSVRRWGKQSTYGEVQITDYRSSRMMEADVDKLVDSKMKRGYSAAVPTWGIASLDPVDQIALKHRLNAHYGLSNAAKVMYRLNVLSGETSPNPIVEESSEIVVEAPAPEPARDASWGSW